MCRIHMLSYYFILTLVALVDYCGCANILGIFPTPSYSHQQPLLAISRALAAKGHNVTVVTTDPSKVPVKNFREIDIHSIYDVYERVEKETGFTLQGRLTGYTLADNFENLFTYVTKAIFDHPEFKKFLREIREANTKYDLVMIESMGYSSFLALAYEGYDKPVPIVGFLTLSSWVSADLYLGNPFEFAYYPTLNSVFNNRMSFFERLENVFQVAYTAYKFKNGVMASQQKIMNEHFSPGLPSAEDMEKNKSLVIMTSDLSTSFLRPLQPNTILIGQTHIPESKTEPLQKDIKDWLDGAEDGAIYFSLGSNMKGTSFPAEKRKAFIEAFSKFPKIRVLWKWESDKRIPGQPENVITRKWLPQKSVLAHPKIKLFITQVGLQSLQETIYYGIPIIGIPVFGDQDYNANMVASAGAGISMEMDSLDFQSVYKNIKSILTDPKYKENILRLQRISKDKPMTSLETAIWWIEYVLRNNGAPHLRPVSVDLPWYQLYLVDIAVFLFVIVLSSVFAIYYTIKKLCYVFKTQRPVKVKSK